MVAELRKRKEKPAPAKEEMPPAKKAARAAPAPKRKAADDASVASPIASKKQKPVKKAAETQQKEDKPAKSERAARKPKAKAPEPEKEEEPVQEEQPEESGAEEEEVDDQTKALVSAIDDDDEDANITTESTFKEGQDVGKIPKVSQKTKKSAEQAVVESASSEGKGVVYVGRIPHGFYEHEMKQYFSQFGPISRLRLSRNKKTGASKHFAFIEFADEATAEIVAKTMDGYLLFGHILRCKTVDSSKIHEGLWKGANRRFKKVPWNKMAGKQLERPLPESKWEAKISKEEKRRAARAEKLKDIGYEFDTPALKAAEAKAPAAIENTEETKAIEPSAAGEEKESEKAEEPAAVEEKTEEAAEPEPAAKKAKATKKKGGKKAKA